LVGWGAYWSEAKSVGFAPLLAAKVVTNDINIKTIIIDSQLAIRASLCWIKTVR